MESWVQTALTTVSLLLGSSAVCELSAILQGAWRKPQALHLAVGTDVEVACGCTGRDAAFCTRKDVDRAGGGACALPCQRLAGKLLLCSASAGWLSLALPRRRAGWSGTHQHVDATPSVQSTLEAATLKTAHVANVLLRGVEESGCSVLTWSLM